MQKKHTIPVGQTKRSARVAAKKKARRSTDCTTARAGRKSEVAKRNHEASFV